MRPPALHAVLELVVGRVVLVVAAAAAGTARRGGTATCTRTTDPASCVPLRPVRGSVLLRVRVRKRVRV